MNSDACAGSVMGAGVYARSKSVPCAARASRRGVRAARVAVAAEPVGAQGVDGDQQDGARPRPGGGGRRGRRRVRPAARGDQPAGEHGGEGAHGQGSHSGVLRSPRPVSASPKNVVTAQDVQAVPPGGELTTALGAIVTPWARELAATRGVRIVQAPAAPGAVVVAVGADHGGFPMKEEIKAHLTRLGYPFRDLGTFSTAAVDYPGHRPGGGPRGAVGRGALGILVDGAGIGSAMAANKVPGVRAAVVRGRGGGAQRPRAQRRQRAVAGGEVREGRARWARSWRRSSPRAAPRSATPGAWTRSRPSRRATSSDRPPSSSSASSAPSLAAARPRRDRALRVPLRRRRLLPGPPGPAGRPRRGALRPAGGDDCTRGTSRRAIDHTLLKADATPGADRDAVRGGARARLRHRVREPGLGAAVRGAAARIGDAGLHRGRLPARRHHCRR